MPYTVKAVTTWADTSLPAEQRQSKIVSLYKTDHLEPNYDPNPVRTLRRTVTNTGDLLARGSVISTDGLSLQTTTVWKSQAAYATYKDDPVMIDYLDRMAKAGWQIDFTFI